MKKNLLFFVTMLAFIISASAQNSYDFYAVSSSGDTLYYYIENNCAYVTFPGPGDYDLEDYWSNEFTQPQGNVVIDGTVVHNDTTYPVIGINDYAFYKCSGITSVTIPNSITTMGGYAFNNCTNLTTVNFPNSITSCGSYVFSGCTSLTSPIYNDNFFVFMPTSATGTYTIPNQIPTICGGAFYQCANLTHVVISNSVTTVGPGAFLECNSLTQPLYNNSLFIRLPLSYSGSYTIPDGIITVCASAFTHTKGLTALIMPNSVKNLGGGAIGYCTNLTYVKLSNALTNIPSFSFMCDSSLQTITLPASIESIGVSAFFRCAALGNLVTKATTPPGATPLSFHGIPATCTLTVPCETSQDYTDEWGSFNVFAEIVEDCRDEFTVTVTSHDPTMGSAMVDGEPSAIVLDGDEAILTAVANEGYHFVRWNDDSTDNPRIIIVTDNITYTAYFEVGEDVSIGNVNASSALIYVADGRIVIESENEASPFLACVYDMTGRQVAMLQSAGKTPALPSGVYLVRLGDKSVHKVVVKNN